MPSKGRARPGRYWLCLFVDPQQKQERSSVKTSVCWVWWMSRRLRVALDSPLPLSLRAKPCKMHILHLSAFTVCLIFLLHNWKETKKKKRDCTSQLFLERWKFTPMEPISIAKGCLLNACLLWIVPQNCLAIPLALPNHKLKGKELSLKL